MSLGDALAFLIGVVLPTALIGYSMLDRHPLLAMCLCAIFLFKTWRSFRKKNRIIEQLRSEVIRHTGQDPIDSDGSVRQDDRSIGWWPVKSKS